MLKTKLIKLYATVENEGIERQEALYFPLSLILEYLDTDDLTEFMEEYTTDDTNELEAGTEAGGEGGKAIDYRQNEGIIQLLKTNEKKEKK